LFQAREPRAYRFEDLIRLGSPGTGAVFQRLAEVGLDFALCFLEQRAQSDGQAKKLAAVARAEALAPTIAKIQSAGFVSINAITRELSEREIPTPKGGKWHPTSVKRLLQRLEASSRTEGDEPSRVE
jgi:hypothetical protein